MKKNTISESSSTKSIRIIIQKIHTSSPLKDSVYEQAATYFSRVPEIEKHLATLNQSLATAQQKLAANKKTVNVKQLKSNVDLCLKKIKLYQSELDEERLERLHKLKGICDEVLSFCIGQNREGTNTKIAKLLGTISLRAPEIKNTALEYNRQNQHLYQAVLSLKLLDQLIEDKTMHNQHILKWSLADDTEETSSFRTEVQVPLLMTSLLHNVGMYHPAAQLILKGESGDEDEFRVLSNDERLALLKCNYEQTLKYLTEGLGLDKYLGGSRVERDIFNKNEEEKSVFIRLLLKSSTNPKQGIGNIIKVPHIYTSVVLPTKRNLAYVTLPKVFQMLNNGVKRGTINKQVVECLLKITGIFPQGYGVAYIPINSKGYELDRYEFAIVNTLYPQEPYSPNCRVATKNQVFISSAGDLNVTPSNNLYFADTQKKLMKISPERLKGILSKLWSNFEERHDELDLIPKCWHPYEYFSFAKRQNMWNKSS
ncbi:MAG: hypothetical protein GY787_19980 [Alteromonadales bacterium]|nr:hypothetical protein [Alteromonadales bacterium]